MVWKKTEYTPAKNFGNSICGKRIFGQRKSLGNILRACIMVGPDKVNSKEESLTKASLFFRYKNALYNEVIKMIGICLGIVAFFVGALCLRLLVEVGPPDNEDDD